MLDYDLGKWGVGFLFQLEGSVLPKTLVWALPATCLAVLLHMYLDWTDFSEEQDDLGIRMGIAGYNTALSFVLVFRTQQGYSRWWQGAQDLQGMRGEWINAFSSLLAFTTKDSTRSLAAERFQHLLVRLMSLLHGVALRQLSTSRVVEFPVIDLHGVDARFLEFLADVPKGTEVVVILQWIQRAVVEAMEADSVKIPAPILSRAFQDLSKGMVNLASAQTISEIPFPFPYAQMINAILILHTVSMPVMMGFLCRDPWWAGGLCFVNITFFWGINYVAQEIESPFGDDANDLPLQAMQESFNQVLAALMIRSSQKVPNFAFDKEAHRTLRTIAMTSDMRTTQLVSESPERAAATPLKMLGRTGTCTSSSAASSLGSGEEAQASAAQPRVLPRGAGPSIARLLRSARGKQQRESQDAPPARRQELGAKRPSIFIHKQGRRRKKGSILSTVLRGSDINGVGDPWNPGPGLDDTDRVSLGSSDGHCCPSIPLASLAPGDQAAPQLKVVTGDVTHLC